MICEVPAAVPSVFHGWAFGGAPFVAGKKRPFPSGDKEPGKSLPLMSARDEVETSTSRIRRVPAAVPSLDQISVPQPPARKGALPPTVWRALAITGIKSGAAAVVSCVVWTPFVRQSWRALALVAKKIRSLPRAES